MPPRFVVSKRCAAILVAVLAGISWSGCSADRLSSYVDTVEWNVNYAVSQATNAIGLTTPARYLVAKNAVRVRSAPTTDARIMGVFAAGETVAVEDEAHGWYLVRYSGNPGWVSARYLRDTNGVDDGARDTMELADPDAKHTAPNVATVAPAKRRTSAASAKPASDVRLGGTTASSRVDGATRPTGAIEVAGIALRWGMSKAEAAERYGERAQRIDASGAVWLRSALGRGGDVPLEWFDLRFCRTGLCGVHYVVNASAAGSNVGDRTAEELEQHYGPPAEDRWTDSKFGRLRLREWRTAKTLIRLSHQEDQSYAAVDYEPESTADARAGRDTDRIARDDAAVH